MKKIYCPLVLAALLASCTASEPSQDNPGNNNYNPGEVSGYLAIKLYSPGGLTGRANGDYQYGSAQENYVNQVRFYFFDDYGKAVEIRKNPIYDPEDQANVPEYFSYYDWEPTQQDNNNPGGTNPGGTEQDVNNSGDLQDGTVEKILSTMVILTAKEAKFPSQVVAIINPSPYVMSITANNPMPDLTDLQDAVSDNLTNLTISSDGSSGNFLMSNSVYIDEDGELTIAQPIAEDNLGYTEEEAQNTPILVYVERAVAKLNLTFNPTYTAPEGGTAPEIVELPDGTILYPTQETITTEDKNYEGSSAPANQINEAAYVKFFGWAVTSTPTLSYVIKNINPAWGEEGDLFGVVNEPWYIHQYHRSFWAQNPYLSDSPTNSDYVFYTFNELSGQNYENAGNNTIPQLGFPMTTRITYMQENANPEGETAAQTQYPTKIIFPAQIVDGEGNALTFAEWNGVKFTLPGLKVMAAQMLDMYYYDDDQDKYIPISPDQLTFITSSEFNGELPLFSKTPNYTVYATLTSASGTNADDPTLNASGLTWYHLSDNVSIENAQPGDFTQIKDTNAYIETVFGDAMIWNNGYTYYYLTINHLGAKDNPGYYGVVRNHVYVATVSGIKGLGTPVWNPNEKIFPEQPSDNGNRLSALIEVLSWRMVTDSYEFEW